MLSSDNAKLRNGDEFPGVTRVLRTVPYENSFFFYKMLDYYLDARARNLEEFLEQLKTIDAQSIAFHVSRWDFGNWFMTTLGDATLARTISNFKDSTSDGEELRSKILNVVQSRLVRLRKFT